ncbi:MAG: YggS family pyridoxal phosphate-dependent enzyme [Gammaproteobacteria bacterium]|jgi:PLP dependent protein|nr:YggS family pyridoxal phosphate-dependent enzyme [Gammaproteobacteria bacterium]MBT4146999.1 YggS family pyridoxal phosphate-dependent enzyme [Gammaproteobacteria bacterium]MBT5223346.1 YggS family pyridoxal phosphate-dependent enzyme [Gammaproteobacteria bacterium]MBT5825258.1 YggS family pyridoxal phosphate-dependent enzyme [Gammaproteobacteria bacterium]MBT5967194.1 YggS family pyridoxal phosphate-dependent enzyme [Gammaproteobacteria bacterium]
MTLQAKKIDKINADIRQAEADAGRDVCSVQLLAVSKTKPAADIIKAYQAGQRQFGESYLQEALLKQKELSCYQICWHFIGPIQSNKTRQIAAHFNWVHSVDRIKIAKRLNEQRAANLPPLNVCLQVNISNEPSKSGFQLDELADAVEQVSKLTNLKLRGVMAIPQPATDYKQQCKPYHLLYQAIKHLNKPELNTFSFGMSGDLRAAIAEGSTIVRVGTALFGSRSD